MKFRLYKFCYNAIINLIVIAVLTFLFSVNVLSLSIFPSILVCLGTIAVMFLPIINLIYPVIFTIGMPIATYMVYDATGSTTHLWISIICTSLYILKTSVLYFMVIKYPEETRDFECAIRAGY